MPKFNYKALDQAGNPLSGTIEAESADAAMNLLASRGYIPSGITGGEAASSGDFLSALKKSLTRVKAPDLILYTKQFRTLLKAGVPILTLLQVLENQTYNPRLKNIATVMARDIKEGASLYDAFKKHPDTFSTLYCSMVRAGETSGALPEVLTRLSYLIEHEHKIKSDVRSALQYPIMVTVALVIAFFVLLTFVVPKFVSIFKAAGLVLPLPTQICVMLHEILINYWYWSLLVFMAVVVGLYYYLKTEQGKYVKDSLLLRLPILGPLFIKAAMSRFASTFAILQGSGVPVLESLKILSGTIGNTAIAREFERIRTRVEQGRGIAQPLSTAKYFTPMVVNMVSIGEESGNLDEMLREVSNHYDDEVDYAVKGLSEALGPILIVGLAGVVGFFALAIFLPMWDLTKIAQR